MTVTAVERCIAVIEVLAGQAEPLELIDISNRVGLPNSATHRILTTLMTRGWIVQDAASQNYALSFRLSALAFRDLDARAVPEIVQSVLSKLSKQVHEYCRLAVVEGEDLIWVARAQGASVGLRYDPDMGQEIVLHATANGKAWLSTLPESEALRIVCARGFQSDRPLGPRAIQDVDTLRQHLADTKARGYGISEDEAEAGTVALAVPFHTSETASAPVAGTISIAGPRVRFGPERYEELSCALHAAAAEISALWPIRTRQRRNDDSGSRPADGMEAQAS